MIQNNTSQLEILKAAARISDFGYGVWAYEKWSELNDKYFDGCLTVGGIFWGLTPHGKSLGYYEPWRNAITLHKSLVDLSSNAWNRGKLLGETFAIDVLLHEMIHQYNRQVDQKDPSEESHNCQQWCDQVNRLIPMLGITTDLKAEILKQKRVNKKVTWVVPEGVLSRRQLASFPHSLRPKGYYESATQELRKSAGLECNL